MAEWWETGEGVRRYLSGHPNITPTELGRLLDRKRRQAGGGGGTGGGPTREERQSARSIVRDWLTQMGLPTSLLKSINEMIIDGASVVEINQTLRETKEYKTRFAGMELRAKNGFNAIDEATYIQYENTLREAARTYGLSKEYIDGAMTGLIGHGVSAVEAVNRIEEGFAAATNAPKEYRDQLFNLYGVTEGQLAEYFLDPDESSKRIMRQWQSARVAGQAQITGFGQLTGRQARDLVSLGVDDEEAEAGFSALAQQKEITGRLVGEAAAGMGVDDQLDAQFGSDAKAQSELKRRRDTRKAEFEGGGGAYANQSGIVGLGSSNL